MSRNRVRSFSVCRKTNLRTFGTNVAKTIYALCPESFCALNFAIRKVQTFWASGWLGLGQFQYMFVLFLQANSVMTEYSTSIAQKIIYIFACLGKHSKSK